MNSRTLAFVLAAALLAAAPRIEAAGGADTDATLLRVFLKDGTSLVSYGEPARVGDRVVFSMPTGAPGPGTPLHLVNLAADKIDWDRTERYSESARATHYIATRAENDYAELTNAVAKTLNDVAYATEPANRLAIVQSARRALADWSAQHFNYRANDVHQMLLMLDEAVNDLRAASGGGRFNLDLVAFTEPPPIGPLMAPPTPREAIEQTLEAARLAESPAERVSLLDAVVVAVARDAASLPADWSAKTKADAVAEIAAEAETDRQYRALSARAMRLVDRRARYADVRGIEQVLRGISRRDEALGAKRPEAVTALVSAVEAKLDAVRQLRLARDRWALRAPEYRKYRLAMAAPLQRLASLGPSLEDIKALAGSTPGSLSNVRRTAAQILKAVSAVAAPDELKSAHALIVSAAQLADSAARIRREAVLSSDMARAWDASSAAAGALMLASRGRAEMLALIRPPDLR